MVNQRVSPSEVRFTQDNIAEKFGVHAHQSDAEEESIENTFKELLYGVEDVDSIRKISCVRKDGRLWVVSGNRRLYVFRKLQEFGRIHEIPINVVPLNPQRFDKMFTTKNDGASVYIRQDRKRAFGDKMADRLKAIYNRWVRDGRPTDGCYPITTRASYGGGGNYNIHETAYTASWPTSAPVSVTRPSSSSSYSYVHTPSYTTSREIPIRQPSPPKPAPRKQDDSWCAIL